MTSRGLRWSVLLLAAGGLTLPAALLAAQGCEPVRFTVPLSLGGAGEAYQPGGQWRAAVGYRRLYSDHFFVGTERVDSLGPSGQSPVFDVHTVAVEVSYAFNDRVRARISIPFQTGTFRRKWADGLEHEQQASGIGDISVQADVWLLRPLTHPRGNVGVGIGIKAPTGSHDRPSQFWLGTGPVDFPADQPIEPGDGGWGILFQLDGFRQVGERATLYLSGSYMASPKAESDVKGAPAPAPNSGLNWSVPDVYSARAGIAFELLPGQGIAASLGGRVDGTPVRDLFGGGDSGTIKRTFHVLYVDPGVSWTRGRDNLILSIPIRVAVDRKKSLTEQATGALNGGGFAQYLFFVSYSHRF